MPAIDATGAGSTGDVGNSVVVLPPPLEVSLLLSLLQPDNDSKKIIRLKMPVFVMFVCFM